MVMVSATLSACLFMMLDSVPSYGSNLIVAPPIPKGESSMRTSKTGRGPLAAGGVAALLASACCLGPLVLITLGVSGAWISNLAALEPYRPLFIGVALVAMFFAWRRVFRPVEKCQPGEVCAVPRVRTGYKAIFWLVSLLVLIALVFPYILPLFY
ncbi:mercuric ion transporter MerT [Alloalcanivorax marinus]